MMKLSDILDAEHVALDVSAADVPDLLEHLVSMLRTSDQLDAASADALANALLCRERLGSTSIGHGVGVPHAYAKNVKKPLLLFARLKPAISYGEPLDGKPVDLVFLLVGPEAVRRMHARLLARIVRLTHDGTWLDELRTADTPQAVIQSVVAAEALHG